MHWADTGLPLRLQLRVRDPGWSWSGGVALDDAGPGDLFLKVGPGQGSSDSGFCYGVFWLCCATCKLWSLFACCWQHTLLNHRACCSPALMEASSCSFLPHLQIRHRNRGETQLVRVDVGVGADGTLLASLSHHHTDFAPYRYVGSVPSIGISQMAMCLLAVAGTCARCLAGRRVERTVAALPCYRYGEL